MCFCGHYGDCYGNGGVMVMASLISACVVISAIITKCFENRHTVQLMQNDDDNDNDNNDSDVNND